MQGTAAPSRRAASLPAPHAGPVTLINAFAVPEGREEAFLALRAETSGDVRAQPGFLSFRLHCALSSDAASRFVDVARPASAAAFAAAHGREAFRRLASQPGWRVLPSSPAPYGEIRAAEA